MNEENINQNNSNGEPKANAEYKSVNNSDLRQPAFPKDGSQNKEIPPIIEYQSGQHRQGAYQTNQPPYGGYPVGQSHQGTYQTNQPPYGGYPVEQPQQGTYQTNQPPYGGYPVGQPQQGTYQTNQPPYGGYPVGQPQQGTYQTNQPPYGGYPVGHPVPPNAAYTNNDPNPNVNKKRSDKAVISMVLGILSLTVCCGSLVLSIPGIILGILALKDKPDNSSHSMAVAGIITSSIGIILFFALIIFYAFELVFFSEYYY